MLNTVKLGLCLFSGIAFFGCAQAEPEYLLGLTDDQRIAALQGDEACRERYLYLKKTADPSRSVNEKLVFESALQSQGWSGVKFSTINAQFGIQLGQQIPKKFISYSYPIMETDMTYQCSVSGDDFKIIAVLFMNKVEHFKLE